MRVRVKFFAELRDLYGREDEFECECKSPQELVAMLFERYKGLKEKAEEYGEPGLIVLVNGRDVRHLKELEGDEIIVSLFPPAAGG